ncbi:hypothetical protein DID88_003027 [Monilinia fructigena]|uniref:Carrier domain-containing protein n=1 Tax=Monilinia fructigena TaxID=38457 RepID=A0A395IH63_9HELO|nr:hypothetical protein DID88_003027 [Monilinia fructigena]
MSVFGVTTSGRKMNLPGIELFVGPTFATVPTVIHVNPRETKGELLRQIHNQSVEQTEYEQFGLENIKQLIQPTESNALDEEVPILRDISPSQNINTHPLNLECQLTTTGLTMKASFDTEVISEFNVYHLLSQFSHVMKQLCLPNDCIISEISTTSPEDLSQIASWNKISPKSVEACLHDLVLEKSAQTPNAEALASWDGNFTYAELNEYSRLIGLSLQKEGVKCGDVVPLLFDKSALAIISMLLFFAPEQLKGLIGIETLCLGSEPITQSDIDIWKAHVGELMTISGPAETSLCTAGSLSGIHRVPYIGNMIGGLSWVAEISDHTRLAPVGVVGELLVEGPVLAREYLNQPDRTAKSFISLPDWLSDKEPKPLRRLYKTGDLVKYNSDGSMQIFGRRDGQVKIRGQRVELEEVEYQVNKALQSKVDSSIEYKCAVDAFSPADDSNLTYLAIFIATKLESTFEVFKNLTSFIIKSLQGQLPPYMVPGLVMPLSMIPMTATKKTDRRTLRSIAGAMSKSELAKYMGTDTKTRVPPSTPMEKTIQRLWSKVLRVSVDIISSEDKFIYLGGDSIRSISFVSMAREEGHYVTVADTFRYPMLRDLAVMMETAARVQTKPNISVAKYQAVPKVFNSNTFSAICESVPRLSEVEFVDLRPCTPTQNFMLTAHSLGQDVFQPYMSFKARLNEGQVDINRLSAAWEQTVARHSILRTVVVASPNDSRVWYQLVLAKHQPEVILIAEGQKSVNEIADLLQESRRHLPACQLIIRESEANIVNCTLHLSHALIDGGCVDALFEDLASFYAGSSFDSEWPQYRDYQNFLLNRSVEDSIEFWSAYTNDLEPCLVQPKEVDCGLHGFHSQKIPLPSTDALRKLCLDHGITLSILIQAAWATTLRRCTGSVDIAFGNIVSNRDIELTGVDKYSDPFFGIIPRRIQVSRDASTEELLKSCHQNFIKCLPYSSYSYLEYFERKYGCSYDQRMFNTVVNYRKFLGSLKEVVGSGSDLVLDNVSSVDPYAFDILLGIDDDDGCEVLAQIDYWESRVSDEQIEELVNAFSAELLSFCSE